MGLPVPMATGSIDECHVLAEVNIRGSNIVPMATGSIDECHMKSNLMGRPERRLPSSPRHNASGRPTLSRAEDELVKAGALRPVRASANGIVVEYELTAEYRQLLMRWANAT
jgi:hypothetical protein